MPEQILYRATVTRVEGSEIYAEVAALGVGQEQGPIDVPSYHPFNVGELIILGEVEDFAEDLVYISKIDGAAPIDADGRNRANHTGTQTASTISDFLTTVRGVRLDEFAAPTAAVSLNNQRIINLGTPTAATDASTKGYVDTASTNDRARANHTGTQLASTISNFDTQVRTSRLDQIAAPTAAVSLNGQKVINLGTPTLGTDAATKTYVDTVPVSSSQLPTEVTVARLRVTSNSDASETSTLHGLEVGTAGNPRLRIDGNEILALDSSDVAVPLFIQEGVSVNPQPTAAGHLTRKDYVDTGDTAAKARANHTGTQLASTISNFDTQVRTNRIDQLAGAGGNVSLNGYKIVGHGSPTVATDLVNKAYVDDFLPGWPDNNLLPNSSFESWLSGSTFANWSTFFGNGTRTVSQGQPRTGLYSVRTTFTGSADQTLDCSPFRVTSGQTYYCEIYVRRSSAAASINLEAAFGNGSDLAPFGANVLEALSTGVTMIPAGTGWTKVSFFATPANVSSTWGALRIYVSGTDTYVEVDDVWMSPVVQVPNQQINYVPELFSLTTTTQSVVARFTVPAGTLAVGDMLELNSHGQVSSTATLVPRFRIGTTGTTADPGFTVATTAAGTANAHFLSTAHLTIATTGPSGTWFGYGETVMNSAIVSTNAGAQALAIDTTVTNYVTFCMQQSAAQTMTIRNASLKKIRGI